MTPCNFFDINWIVELLHDACTRLKISISCLKIEKPIFVAQCFLLGWTKEAAAGQLCNAFPRTESHKTIDPD